MLGFRSNKGLGVSKRNEVSNECKGKLVIDGSRNQTRQHDQLLLLTRVVQRAKIHADDDLNDVLETETPEKSGETFGLTATINRNAKYNVMTKNFGVTPFSENKPPYSNVGKLNWQPMEQQAHH
jgi:hypothetical protein